MRKDAWPEDACPITRSMSVLGERWALLIVREALLGRSRFSEFRSELGVAPDILSSRLSTLVAAGVLTAVDYQDPGDRRRQRYELTSAGRELSTVLAALAQWGRSYMPPEQDNERRFVDTATGEPVRACLRNSEGQVVEPGQVILADMSRQ